MTYGFVFFLFGVALAYQAFRLGGWWLALLWPAASFFVVAAAYVAARPRWLGKRPDGRLSLPVASVLAPFTAFSWGVAQGHRVLRRGPASSEVGPGIWLGRRAARDVDEAVAMLTKARPGVRLTRRQHDLVRRVTTDPDRPS